MIAAYKARACGIPLHESKIKKGVNDNENEQ